MGIPPLAIRMFVFYCGIISDLTPPVALAAMVAAPIAGAKPVTVGVIATRLALIKFLLPLVFAIALGVMALHRVTGGGTATSRVA
jgi:TRAP-type uncharacterized transport system fused permease subunit